MPLLTDFFSLSLYGEAITLPPDILRGGGSGKYSFVADTGGGSISVIYFSLSISLFFAF